jgi:ribbon-helix-helix CopG family protein
MMKLLKLSLTEQQLARLQGLKQQTGLGYSELLRRALDNYLDTLDNSKTGA